MAATVENTATEILQMVMGRARELGVQPCDLVEAVAASTPKRRGRPPKKTTETKKTTRKYTNGRPKVPFAEVEEGELVVGDDGRLWQVAEVATKKAGVTKKTWKLVRDQDGRPVSATPDVTDSSGDEEAFYEAWADELSAEAEQRQAASEVQGNGEDKTLVERMVVSIDLTKDDGSTQPAYDGVEYTPENMEFSSLPTVTLAPYNEDTAENLLDGIIVTGEHGKYEIEVYSVEQDDNTLYVSCFGKEVNPEHSGLVDYSSDEDSEDDMLEQYDTPCIGSQFGCPAKTNGSQYCGKTWCPYEDEAQSGGDSCISPSTNDAAHILAGMADAVEAPHQEVVADEPAEVAAEEPKTQRKNKTCRPETPAKELDIGTTQEDSSGRTWIVAEKGTRGGGKCKVWKLQAQ